jgi:hypothetical protein
MSEKISEADDLARRFIAVWADYLSALVADPKTSEPLRRWFAIAVGSLQNPSAGDVPTGVPPRPPPGSPPGSPTDAATAAGPPGERDALVAELARRVDELAQRVAALERPGERAGKRGGRAPGATRRQNPSVRS